LRNLLWYNLMWLSLFWCHQLLSLNLRSSLWFLGRSDFMFDIIGITSQFILFVVVVKDVKLQDTGVYGATNHTTCRSLWSTLVNLHHSWCILGDFILFFVCAEDVKGGVAPSLISCIEFSYWTNSNEHVEAPSSWSFYTCSTFGEVCIILVEK